jgi:hypothetical protein
MEYEAGLDRKSAILAAFALYFPEDYRAMKKAAAGTPDRETALYEYLEDLIKTGPQTCKEGPTMDANVNCGEAHGRSA